MGYIFEGLIRAVELIISLDPEIIDITLLSLEVSGAAVILAAMIGIPLGAFITLNEFPLKRTLKNIIYTLMGLPPVVAGLLVFLMVSRAGPLGSYGILFTPTAMIIAQFLLVTPIITGLTMSATRAVDRPIIDTAISMGSTKFGTTMIVLNEARQAIMVALLAGFGRAIAEVGAVMIVGGDIRWSTRVLTTSIVLETRKGDFGLAIALGIILLSMSFIINMVMNYIQEGSPR